MSRIIISIFFLLLQTQLSLAKDWKELKGEHFIVYYVKDETFSRKVLRKAEKNYSRIANDLGYARSSNFWTWANRVGIYIHADRDSYVQIAGEYDWSEGMADYTNKQIISYVGSTNFLDSILPHEIAHLIFRDFIGFKSEVPLWLDEGVAQWEEEVDRGRIIALARQYLDNRTFLNLKKLTQMDVRSVSHTDKLHMQAGFIEEKPTFFILDGKSLIDLFYVQSASLVGFLIERYGTENFTIFCRHLRDGKSLEEALSFVYTAYMKDLDEFELKWIEYLRSK